jgi:hypothetical protein
MSRLSASFFLSLLAAIQGFMISIPFAFAYGMRHAPKSEFAGIAVLGTVLVTGGITSSIVLISTAFAAYRYCHHFERWFKIFGTSIAGTVLLYLVFRSIMT